MGKKKQSSNLKGLLVLILGIFLIASATGAVSAIRHAAVSEIPVGSSESSWIRSLLGKLGDPRNSQADISSLAAWISHETENWPPEDPSCNGLTVVNNPMNTGQLEPGSSSLPCNTSGVQVYPNLSVGLQGTYDTLENGRYNDILAQLRNGAGLASGASTGLSTWSGGAYTSLG
jgi:hypothetical protein